jgi:hypothetical protein
MKLIEQGMRPDAAFDLKSFSLIGGLVTASVGFVLSIFFVMTADGSYILLGGLIPLAVGLSLLAYYVFRQHEPR